MWQCPEKIRDRGKIVILSLLINCYIEKKSSNILIFKLLYFNLILYMKCTIKRNYVSNLNDKTLSCLGIIFKIQLFLIINNISCCEYACIYTVIVISVNHTKFSLRFHACITIAWLLIGIQLFYVSFGKKILKNLVSDVLDDLGKNQKDTL